MGRQMSVTAEFPLWSLACDGTEKCKTVRCRLDGGGCEACGQLPGLVSALLKSTSLGGREWTGEFRGFCCLRIEHDGSI